jgi:hypothetical protein
MLKILSLNLYHLIGYSKQTKIMSLNNGIHKEMKAYSNSKLMGVEIIELNNHCKNT